MTRIPSKIVNSCINCGEYYSPSESDAPNSAIYCSAECEQEDEHKVKTGIDFVDKILEENPNALGQGRGTSPGETRIFGQLLNFEKQTEE